VKDVTAVTAAIQIQVNTSVVQIVASAYKIIGSG
jgi:hypothetical protein